jgi:hypothetical protein
MSEREKQERAKERAEFISKLWLILGCGMLGVLSGLLVGLSVSPIANTAMGLLLGFAGAIFSLSKKSEPEMTRMGQTTFVFALFTFVGLVLGLVSRTHDVLKPKPSPVEARYIVKAPPTVQEIITLAKSAQDPEVVRRIVLASPRIEVTLSQEDLKQLAEEGVHPAIILAMLEPEHPMNRFPIVFEKADLTVDGGMPVMGEMLKASHSSGTKDSGSPTVLYGEKTQQDAAARDAAGAHYRD